MIEMIRQIKKQDLDKYDLHLSEQVEDSGGNYLS